MTQTRNYLRELLRHGTKGIVSDHEKYLRSSQKSNKDFKISYFYLQLFYFDFDRKVAERTPVLPAYIS